MERNSALVDALERTRAKLSADSVQVVAADALTLSRGWPDASFDVIFLDPPFDSGLLPAALVEAARLATPGGFVYVESGTPLTDAVAGMQLVRTARAGHVHFHLLQRA